MNEEQATPGLIKALEAALAACGVVFDTGGFRLHNTHATWNVRLRAQGLSCNGKPDDLVTRGQQLLLRWRYSANSYAAVGWRRRLRGAVPDDVRHASGVRAEGLGDRCRF